MHTSSLCLALIAFGVAACVTEGGRPPDSAVTIDKAPDGLRALASQKGRVRAFHANGADNFLFRGDTARFSAFLNEYARLDLATGHRLVVRKGRGQAKAPGEKGEGEACDWVLDVAFAGWGEYHVWREHHGEVLEDPFGRASGSKKPEYLAGVLVWTGGDIDLEKVTIPENIKVVREDQVSLVLRAGREAAVGRPVDLVFVLRNNGNRDFAFLEDFCPLGIVHEATFDVTEPGGATLPSAGRISVGGPAFLGSGHPRVVKPREEVELPCSLPDAEKKLVWSPGKAGSHQIVAHYRLPVPSSRPASPGGEIPDYIVVASEPLSIDAVRPQ